ncbi:MAG TPA: ABC transporter substrate-binding protein [Candidatus Binatia bacterium]|jgi:NitT/TauT family transport system substrate-binding protein|nr:ABC transporter substrate-binding protein [Candidatus Binatia bacterium]
MNQRLVVITSAAFVVAFQFFTFSLFAASVPHKVIFTFGGLNERSGVLFVGRDAGIFQKHGLDATVVNVRNAQVGMSALASGETQFHVGSATGTSIGAMAGGLDLVFIAGLINKLDGAFVVNPSIRSPAELKGKKIGVQSIGGGVWMFSMLAFEHWGLNPERDNIQFRIIGDQAVMAQALTQNVIDGAYLGYTFGAQLERQGYRVLADLAKIGVPYQGLGVMARRSIVDRSPDMAERTLRAMVETIAYINNPNNKSAVMRSLAKDLRLSEVEDAQPGYEMMKTLYDRRIYPNVEGLRNVIRLLANSSEPIRRLKVEDIIDDRVVRKLEKEGLF